MPEDEEIEEAVGAIDDAVADLLRARQALVGDGGQGVLIDLISATLERNEDFVAAVVTERATIEHLRAECGEEHHKVIDELQEAVRVRAGLSADAGFQIGLCVANQVMS